MNNVAFQFGIMAFYGFLWRIILRCENDAGARCRNIRVAHNAHRTAIAIGYARRHGKWI